jgi:hypothetical protein
MCAIINTKTRPIVSTPRQRHRLLLLEKENAHKPLENLTSTILQSYLAYRTWLGLRGLVVLVVEEDTTDEWCTSSGF